MLPFVLIDPSRTFGIQPFGFFVVLAMLVGEPLMVWRARRVGLDEREMRALFWWCLLVGLFVSHVLDSIFYHPQEVAHRPWSLLFVWEGLSSMGGFVGAAIAAFAWSRYEWTSRGPKRRATTLAILPYNDVVLATFPIPWTIARIGCLVVHDHPGTKTAASTWLSVAYPSGNGGETIRHVWGPLSFLWGDQPRHDLGLLEMLFCAVLSVALALTWAKRTRLGFYGAVVPLAYAPVRFVLDFMRAQDVESADARYASLTFAQYACIALFAFGITMWRRSLAR